MLKLINTGTNYSGVNIITQNFWKYLTNAFIFKVQYVLYITLRVVLTKIAIFRVANLILNILINKILTNGSCSMETIPNVGATSFYSRLHYEVKSIASEQMCGKKTRLITLIIFTVSAIVL